MARTRAGGRKARAPCGACGRGGAWVAGAARLARGAPKAAPGAGAGACWPSAMAGSGHHGPRTRAEGREARTPCGACGRGGARVAGNARLVRGAPQAAPGAGAAARGSWAMAGLAHHGPRARAAFGKRLFSAGSRQGGMVLGRRSALSDETPLGASGKRMAAPPGRCPSGRPVTAAPVSGSDRSAARETARRIPLVGRRRHPPAGTCPWAGTIPRPP